MGSNKAAEKQRHYFNNQIRLMTEQEGSNGPNVAGDRRAVNNWKDNRKQFIKKKKEQYDIGDLQVV